MSERDEPGMDELERRLDAAFGATRPRRGFEDELWARLQARRPWWRRLGGGLGPAQWAGAATAVTALVIVALVVTLVRFAGPHGGLSAASTSAGPRSASASQAAPSSAPGAGAADQAALPFGRLPPPSAAGVPRVVQAAGPSPLPAGGARVTAPAAGPVQPASSLAVYRYAPGAGPADGTILETSALPSGLTAGLYPSRPAADALADATAASVAGQPVVLTQSRLVYVAVVSGGQGFLEPAYLYTGTAGGAPAQLLVSALAPSALR